MSTKLRSHGKSMVVWVLLAMLVLGLGGFGVTSFNGRIQTIGAVGGTEIGVSDYANALRGEMNAATAQLGRPLSLAEAKSLGLDRAVQARLFNEAALAEQASRLALSVGNDVVRKEITGASAFQGPDGKFDREAYREMLRRQGYTETSFEARLRTDIARSLLQGAAAGGASVPQPLIDTYLAFLGETRDLAFAEVSEADLSAPPPSPDEAALKAYYEAHIADFTRPETREITYVWLTPEMLKDKAGIDEARLRAAYDERRAEFVQPERRLVLQLVFPTRAEAEAGMAKIAAGEASLTELALERGLAEADIDLGAVTEDEIGGEAGAAVFALQMPDVIGPYETDLGPALFKLVGIEPGEETSFEAARADLETELAMERARRMIADMSSDLEDRLASGATLEEMEAETEMVLGRISLAPDTSDGIAGYESFRDLAAKLTAEDFPELVNLEDGGVFAARLDAITPAAPIAFDEARAAVAEAWLSEAVSQQKAARAAQLAEAVKAGQSLGAQGLLVTQVSALARGGFVEGAPQALSNAAFETEPGTAQVLREGNRVFVLEARSVTPADLASPEMTQLAGLLKSQLGQSMGDDLIDLYARAAQAEAGITLDATAINAVQAQMQ